MSVSIIMPIYNAEKYIKKSIESILNQSYKNFELIIIDDGSNDNSKNIIKKYNDIRIKYFYFNHQGISKCLNFAIITAKYNLIFRMDADDIADKKRIEIQKLYMDTHPEVTLCGSFIYILNNKGKNTKKNLPVQYKDIKKLIVYNSCVMHPTFCFKKNDIISVGGYNDKFKYAQDYDLLLRLITANFKIFNIPKYLLSYRPNDKISSSKLLLKIRYTDLALYLYKNNYTTNLEILKKYKTINKITNYDKFILNLFRHVNFYRQKYRLLKFIVIPLSYFVALFHNQLLKFMIMDFIYYFLLKKIKN